jgi:hypothetical protein
MTMTVLIDVLVKVLVERSIAGQRSRIPRRISLV